MKGLNKIVIFIDRLVNTAIILFFITILLFGIYAFIDAFQVYKSAELPEKITQIAPTANGNDDNYSLDKLKEINEDICGWIKFDNTNIDYPIVKGEDNSEYLNKDYENKFAITGSIFLDYRNDSSFSDDYSVVYGHNMKSKKMFADIKKFSNKDFFDNNEYGTLYTENGKYKIHIMCYEKVSAFSDKVYGIGQNNVVDLSTYLYRNALNKREMSINKNDKIIVLSTCDVAGGSSRAILVGRLEKNKKQEAVKTAETKEIKAPKSDAETRKMWLNIIVFMIMFLVLILILLIYLRKKIII